MKCLNIIFVVVAVVVSSVSGGCVNAPNKATGQIRVGAFNIRKFGVAKMNDPVAANQIVTIMLGYDIILIQEITDSTMKSVPKLFNLLNANESMNYRISARLGRNSYKEQYAFFYKTEFIDIEAHHQFVEEAGSDIYEREPYSVRVNVKQTGLQMSLVALHAKPADAVKEIRELQKVYNDVLTVLGTENVVILGNLNADCSYASISELETCFVFTDARFVSLIPHDADTTVSNTDCAYDRIIISSNLTGRIVSAGVHRFDAVDELNLTQAEALKLSYHYLVEMILIV